MIKNITIVSCHSREGGNLDTCFRKVNTKFVSPNSIGFTITAGQAHDLQGSDALMEKLTQGFHVLADKAYDAYERVRNRLKEKGCVAVIPSRKNRKIPI